MFKKIILVLLGVVTPLAASSTELTEPRLVDDVQISTDGTYNFYNSDGWGAKGCPNAKYIYVRKNEATSADAILSVVLTSQSMGRTVFAKGVCRDQLYFKIEYIRQK